jgi:hypothetical protein
VFAGLPKSLQILADSIKAREFMSLANRLLGLFCFLAIPLSAVVGLGVYATRIYRYFTGRTGADVAAPR